MCQPPRQGGGPGRDGSLAPRGRGRIAFPSEGEASAMGKDDDRAELNRLLATFAGKVQRCPPGHSSTFFADKNAFTLNS